MKLLLLQKAGEHKGNKLYKEALCLQYSLIALGHDAIVCGDGYDMPLPAMETLDAIVYLENYDIDTMPDLHNAKCLKIFWSIDGFCCKESHEKFIQKNKIDVVLSSTRGIFPHEIWFPNAYPAHLFDPVISRKFYSSGYCGTYGTATRKDFIEKLAKEIYMQTDIFVIGDDMVRAIKSYNIHFNQNIGNDINCRTFETLGAGTFLLTNETDGLKDLFNIGTDFVTYNSYEDCVDKIRHYTIHQSAREEIAISGYASVCMNHTYDKRAEELIKIIGVRQ